MDSKATIKSNKIAKNILDETRQVCIWEYDQWSDYYETGCNNGFFLSAGTIKDNGMKYCPYCGLPLKVKNEREE